MSGGNASIGGASSEHHGVMTLDERCVIGVIRLWTDRIINLTINPRREMHTMNRRTLMSVASAIALLAAAPAAMADTVGVKMSGMFEGRSNHETAGTVSIIEEDGRTFVDLGALVSMNAKQRYAVPPTWDVTDYNEVYIWCEVAGVPLGVASLK
jgi:hypothetical protein